MIHHGFWLGFVQYGAVPVLLAFFGVWMRRSTRKSRPPDEINLLKPPVEALVIYIAGAGFFLSAFAWALFGRVYPDNPPMMILTLSVFGLFGLFSVYYCVDYFRHWHLVSDEGILSGRLMGTPRFLLWKDVAELRYRRWGDYLELRSTVGETTRISSVKYSLGMTRFSELVLARVSPNAIAADLRRALIAVADGGQFPLR